MMKLRMPTIKMPTTNEDDDYHFFVPFISLETFDSKVDAASTFTLDGATPPHPTIDDNDDTTTVMMNTTMTMTLMTDDDDDEDDFFAPPVLPSDSTVNNCASWMTIPDNQHANHQPLPTQPTTHWIHDSFAPIFQAVDHLAATITDLSDNILAALETLTT